MSTTRAEVLRKLRNWGQPVAPATLAGCMDRSPQRVSSILSDLYGLDIADRKPDPIYPHRYLYSAKAINA